MQLLRVPGAGMNLQSRWLSGEAGGSSFKKQPRGPLLINMRGHTANRTLVAPRSRSGGCEKGGSDGENSKYAIPSRAGVGVGGWDDVWFGSFRSDLSSDFNLKDSKQINVIGRDKIRKAGERSIGQVS